MIANVNKLNFRYWVEFDELNRVELNFNELSFDEFELDSVYNRVGVIEFKFDKLNFDELNPIN